jgi:chorismate mutase
MTSTMSAPPATAAAAPDTVAESTIDPDSPTHDEPSTAAAAAGRSEPDGSAAPPQAVADEVVPEVPVPTDQAGIDELRLEIDRLDAEIVRLIQRRTAVSHAIGTARKQLGGPRIVYSREMAILERFRVLGPSGTDLGMLLLAMGRGRLGRK